MTTLLLGTAVVLGLTIARVALDVHRDRCDR